MPAYDNLIVVTGGPGSRLVELPRAEPAERLRFVIRDLSPPA
jgi:hypothetical protein